MDTSSNATSTTSLPPASFLSSLSAATPSPSSTQQQQQQYYHAPLAYILASNVQNMSHYAVDNLSAEQLLAELNTTIFYDYGDDVKVFPDGSIIHGNLTYLAEKTYFSIVQNYLINKADYLNYSSDDYIGVISYPVLSVLGTLLNTIVLVGLLQRRHRRSCPCFARFIQCMCKTFALCFTWCCCCSRCATTSPTTSLPSATRSDGESFVTTLNNAAHPPRPGGVPYVMRTTTTTTATANGVASSTLPLLEPQRQLAAADNQQSPTQSKSDRTETNGHHPIATHQAAARRLLHSLPPHHHRSTRTFTPEQHKPAEISSVPADAVLDEQLEISLTQQPAAHADSGFNVPPRLVRQPSSSTRRPESSENVAGEARSAQHQHRQNQLQQQQHNRRRARAGSQRTMLDFHILNLCIADLWVSVVHCGVEGVWRYYVEWPGSEWLCKLVAVVRPIGLFAVSFIIASIALDRLIAVTKPLSCMPSASARARFMIRLSWALALICSLPQAMYFKVLVHPLIEPEFRQCRFVGTGDDDGSSDEKSRVSLATYAWLNLTTLYYMPMAVMIICYSVIFFKLRYAAIRGRYLTSQPSSAMPTAPTTINRSSTISGGQSTLSLLRMRYAGGDAAFTLPRSESNTSVNTADVMFNVDVVENNIRNRTASIRTANGSATVPVLPGQDIINTGAQQQQQQLYKWRLAANVYWRRQTRHAFMLSVQLVGAFIVCTAPYALVYSYYLLTSEQKAKKFDPHIREVLLAFSASNSIINPILYGRKIIWSVICGLHDKDSRLRTDDVASCENASANRIHRTGTSCSMFSNAAPPPILPVASTLNISASTTHQNLFVQSATTTTTASKSNGALVSSSSALLLAAASSHLPSPPIMYRSNSTGSRSPLRHQQQSTALNDNNTTTMRSASTVLRYQSARSSVTIVNETVSTSSSATAQQQQQASREAITRLIACTALGSDALHQQLQQRDATSEMLLDLAVLERSLHHVQQQQQQLRPHKSERNLTTISEEESAGAVDLRDSVGTAASLAAIVLPGRWQFSNKSSSSHNNLGKHPMAYIDSDSTVPSAAVAEEAEQCEKTTATAHAKLLLCVPSIKDSESDGGAVVSTVDNSKRNGIAVKISNGDVQVRVESTVNIHYHIGRAASQQQRAAAAVAASSSIVESPSHSDQLDNIFVEKYDETAF